MGDKLVGVVVKMPIDGVTCNKVECKLLSLYFYFTLLVKIKSFLLGDSY